MKRARREALLAGGGGLLVALGLGIAGLTDAAKVIGFLDFFGNWDATALLVLASATLVFGVGYRVLDRAQATRSPSQPLRPDRRLVLGAVLFGVGWGATGLCPAPALTLAAAGALPSLVFVAAMVAGMAVHAWSIRRKGIVPSGAVRGSSCP